MGLIERWYGRANDPVDVKANIEVVVDEKKVAKETKAAKKAAKSAEKKIKKAKKGWKGRVSSSRCKCHTGSGKEGERCPFGKHQERSTRHQTC